MFSSVSWSHIIITALSETKFSTLSCFNHTLHNKLPLTFWNNGILYPSPENLTMADRCHLLRLPGEIRNLIYEYVLFEDTSLQYIHCAICDRGSIRARVKELDSPDSHGTTVNKTEKNHDPKEAKQLAFPLINKSEHVHGQNDANQPKFVNRQLYNEKNLT
ncbi:Nn.00g005670.m01.CDS01 [Neocucurbitaria sp. VM-36]